MPSDPALPHSPRHDARQDAHDARDIIYAAATGYVPEEAPLSRYADLGLPVHDQGDEFSCTGFGLAAVVDHGLRRREAAQGLRPASPRMLYEMARRYDGVTDPDHKGSTPRGALKGWHKHGVCGWAMWPYVADVVDRELTPERAADAVLRRLGGYHRVPAKDVAAMRAAIWREEILYVTADVHGGWHQVGADGAIPYPGGMRGTHAFVLIGYDSGGFWLQNSKGAGWGRDGYGYLSEADWLANGQDAWVARLPL